MKTFYVLLFAFCVSTAQDKTQLILVDIGRYHTVVGSVGFLGASSTIVGTIIDAAINKKWGSHNTAIMAGSSLSAIMFAWQLSIGFKLTSLSDRYGND